jgi:hypothetical protein
MLIKFINLCSSPNFMVFSDQSLEEMVSQIDLQEKFNHNLHLFGSQEEYGERMIDYVLDFGFIFLKYIDSHKVEVNTAIQEALANVYFWGKGRGLYEPAKVEWYLGTRGLVFSVTNPGKGFDYEKVISDFRSGEKYARRHGGGMIAFAMKGYEVSFDLIEEKDNIKYARRTNILLKR